MANSANAQIGAGCDVKYWKTTASPPAYTALGKIRSVGGIGVKNPEVESTTLDSTGVERLSGLPDGKEVTIRLTNTAASLLLCETLVAAKTAIDLKVTKPSPSSDTRYFSFLPLEYEEMPITPSGLLELELKGRITGAAPSSVDPHP